MQIPFLFRLLIASTVLVINARSVQSFAMTWKDTWDDILDGGPTRWKVDDLDAKEKALAHILEHHGDGDDAPKLRILCPLAGDDPFVRYAWSEGHDVTAIDVVPAALRAMRGQFGDGTEDWTSESHRGGGGLVWRHRSGRATLYEGDVFAKRPELANRFDVVYDKDSFGALPLEMRPKLCERLSEVVRDGGTVYVEVKNKKSGRDVGPPFHVEREDLMEPTAFGTWFEHRASLGEVYPLKGPGMKQMGHILRRVMRP